jgi:pantoate--beta-alanine ligase
MNIVTTIDAIREQLARERDAGQTISFVPTMGNLHEGHMALIEAARQASDRVVVSIFVNPMQFGQNEDLDSYPRTLADDQEKLVAAGVDYLFAPNVRDMYPKGIETQITVPVLSHILCGVSRPGFFTGVATICVKLFNIVQPDIAVFGEKDWQQLTIIRHVVADLWLPLEIMGVATGRADDGLALSSRNGYLTVAERAIAPALYQTLCHTRQQIVAGDRDYSALEQAAIRRLDQAGFKHDYVKIVNRHTLEYPTSADRELVIVAAAQLGGARLIDNLLVDIA